MAGAIRAGRARRMVFGCASVLLGLIVLAFAAEIALRFFPVNEGFHTQPVNSHDPILRFEPNRTFTWSRGWNFSLVNRLRTNNYGFVSNIDYDPAAGSPLLAIIGDSFIEAAMVPWDQTGPGRLARRVGRTGRVYSFGTGGAPLSQYLMMSKYVRDTFHPNGLVIQIIGNDFDSSMLKYYSEPGFHYFVADASGALQLKRVNFQPGFFRKARRFSALIRYLLLDANLYQSYQGLKGFSTLYDDHRVLAGHLSKAESERIADSRQVVDTFLSMLPEMSGLEKSNILLLIDGMRPALYNEKDLRKETGTYFDFMRNYLMEKGRSGGFQIIDLQPHFIEHYSRHHQRFEFPTDGHWNSIGHEVFARTVAGSDLFARIFGKN